MFMGVLVCVCDVCIQSLACNLNFIPHGTTFFVARRQLFLLSLPNVCDQIQGSEGWLVSSVLIKYALQVEHFVLIYGGASMWLQ